MKPTDAISLFEILVRENSAMLTAYLRTAVHDSALVDDLFQETMIAAWQTIGRYDRTRPFGPWLRGIAAKLILVRRRQDANSVMICDEEVLKHLDYRFASVESRAGDTLEEKLAVLRECIEALPTHYRDLVVLRYRQELPGDLVAKRLNINMETLKKRLQRARSRLLACLNGKLASIGVTR